jgi:serine/threonine protein kinase
MASGDDPRFDDSTETELRPAPDATLTSGPPTAPAEAPTLVREGAGGALPDLGLVTVLREHYLVEGEIARGGMGRVFAARDRRLGRPVALKELLTTSPELARRFEREALMTARLQHPSIVNVHEAGRWPSGEPFYAMKRVVGQPLDSVVRKARSLDERLALLPNVLAVAEAGPFVTKTIPGPVLARRAHANGLRSLWSADGTKTEPILL